MASTPEFGPRPHYWKASAFTTAPSRLKTICCKKIRRFQSCVYNRGGTNEFHSTSQAKSPSTSEQSTIGHSQWRFASLLQPRGWINCVFNSSWCLLMTPASHIPTLIWVISNQKSVSNLPHTQTASPPPLPPSTSRYNRHHQQYHHC